MATASITDYLDAIEDLIDNAGTSIVPPGKSTVDVGQIKSYINSIRVSLPNEIRQARTLVKDRANVLETAKREADDIIAKAEARAAALVNEHEITKKAQQRAIDTENQTADKLKTARGATNSYLIERISSVEETLTANLAQVQKLKATLKDSK